MLKKPNRKICIKKTKLRLPLCFLNKVNLRLFGITWLIGTIILFLMLIPVSNGENTSTQNLSQKTVLFITSSDENAPIIQEVKKGIIDTFSQQNEYNINLVSEYLNLWQYNDASYKNLLIELFRFKLKKLNPDVIITVDSPAKTLIETINNSKIPVLPLVTGPRDFEVMKNNVSPEEIVLNKTLPLAKSFFPNSKKIVIIGGFGVGDIAEISLLKKYFNQNNIDFEIEWLTNNSLKDIERIISDLPEDNIILFTRFTNDINGDVYSFDTVFKELNEKSNRPIFAIYNNFIGEGLLGGYLIDLTKIGSTTGNLTLQILHDKEKRLNYVDPNSLIVSQYDWREINRWGIDPSLIPPNATILFREQSFIEYYLWYIVLILLIITIETFLISILLIYRKKHLIVERELKESENRFRILFEQTPEAIFIFDTDKHKIVDINKNVEKLMGLPREDILNIKPEQFYAEKQPDDCDITKSFESHIVRALKGEEVIFERIVRNINGKEIYCEVRLIRLSSQGSNLVRALFIDITERKKAEIALINYRDHLEELVKERTLQLAIAKEEAEAANRAKSVFVSNMSHELRTPLNAILGYSQIFLNRQIGEEFKLGLQTIQKSGEHLLTLIDDILDLAKIEAGKIELFPHSTNFPSFIDGINSIIQIRAELKGLKYIVKISGSIPVSLHLDETRMRQVLLNILGNAVKYTDKGQVVFRIIILEGLSIDNPNRVRIRFEIEDTGIGISSESQNLIFRPFQQIGDSSYRDHGTGLGLAISHELVALMGGEIQFVSEFGKGSRFWFDLTIPYGSEIPHQSEEIELEIIGYFGEKKRILIVDDIESNRNVIIDLLHPLGFEVIPAVNGMDAIRIALDTKPDLIIMDLKMPVMDGYTALNMFRKNPDFVTLPIIAYSASASQAEQDNVRMGGFQDFILKPISWSNISKILQKHLQISWKFREPVHQGIMIDQESLPETREIIPPPADVLDNILELSERGDVLAVIDAAKSTEALGMEYHTFAHKIQTLAERYEMKEIILFLNNFIRKE